MIDEYFVKLIKDLTDVNPCNFDHHGYCQEHNWMGKDCPHLRAKKFLMRMYEDMSEKPHDKRTKDDGL